MKKLILSLPVAFFASWAGAQTVLFDSSVFTNASPSVAASENDVIWADDATLASPGVITSLEIDFVYSGFTEFGDPVASADFVFALWEDNAGDPSSTPLWDSGVTNLTFNPGTFADFSTIRHLLAVDVPDIATSGSKVYWSVETHNVVVPTIGTLGIAFNNLSTAASNSVDDYVPGTDTEYNTIWRATDQNLGDAPAWAGATSGATNPFAVTIFGVAVPEPSMAGLFLVGLGCLGMIRKLKTM